MTKPIDPAEITALIDKSPPAVFARCRVAGAPDASPMMGETDAADS
jgi:hypothetical protein